MYNMKKLIKIFNRMFCKYCGRSISDTGSGMDMGGMCERCYENGGDDEWRKNSNNNFI